MLFVPFVEFSFLSIAIPSVIGPFIPSLPFPLFTRQ